MEENRPRSQEIFAKAKPESPPAPAQGKIGKMLGSVLGLFAGPLAGGSAKQPASAPKSESLLAAVLGAQKIDLRAINQFLAVILACLAALTGYVIFRRPPAIADVTSAVAKIKYEDIEDSAMAPFEQLSVYLDQIKQRDIFNEYKEYVPPPPPPAPVAPPAPPKVTIQEKAKNLKLMGISWGASPKAMIQDQSTNETHFLSAGQKVKGTEVTIKTILKDEVIVESDGDEMKLL